MFTLPRNLRVVELRSPYDCLEQDRARLLFSRIMALKIRGYRAVYPYGVLPVDGYDFIATHLAVCEEGPSYDWLPLMAFRTVSWERCQRHRLPFHGLSVLRASGARIQEQSLERHLEFCGKDGIAVSYGSSWTIDPRVRDEPELKRFLRDLMAGMLVCHERESGSGERLTCGTFKVKTDKFFQDLGYERLAEQGIELPPFQQTSLFGESVAVLRCARFSPAGLELAERYEELWRGREILGAESASENDVERKAA